VEQGIGLNSQPVAKFVAVNGMHDVAYDGCAKEQ